MRRIQNGCSGQVENVQGKCRKTCDFIATGLHHEHFLRNAPTFFKESYFKVALTTCKGIYLFGEPNTYCFDRTLETDAFNESYSRKKLF